MAGLWRADPDAERRLVEVPIPARETILVLEGSVRVGVDGGEPRTLAVGDMISIPARSMVGWDAAPDCVVFWIYS
jgi:quercetin dioxygenase-like cupin family protein